MPVVRFVIVCRVCKGHRKRPLRDLNVTEQAQAQQNKEEKIIWRKDPDRPSKVKLYEIYRIGLFYLLEQEPGDEKAGYYEKDANP